MALSYNLGYQESISVHPTRRQNFAGKPYSNFPNIWEWLIYNTINKLRADCFQLGFDKHLIICWRTDKTSLVESEVNLIFGNFQRWCNALKLLFNPFTCLPSSRTVWVNDDIHRGNTIHQSVEAQQGSCPPRVTIKTFLSNSLQVAFSNKLGRAVPSRLRASKWGGGMCCLTWDSQ